MPGGVDTKSMEAINAYVDNKREVAAFLNASRDEISKNTLALGVRKIPSMSI